MQQILDEFDDELKRLRCPLYRGKKFSVLLNWDEGKAAKEPQAVQSSSKILSGAGQEHEQLFGTNNS